MIQAWHSITLWKRVLIGLAIGLLVGAVIRYGVDLEPVPILDTNGAAVLDESGEPRFVSGAAYIGENYIYPFGRAFVRLIKMLIIPLIATTLVAGVTAMGDPKKLGTLGARTMALYLVTTFFAVSLGLGMGAIVRPGVGVVYDDADSNDISTVQGKMSTADEAGGLVERLLDIIPTNPFEAMVETKVLPTIFFSIMVGVGILLVGPPADPVRKFFDAAADVILKITVMIMELAPYGVAALMAWVMCKQGCLLYTSPSPRDRQKSRMPSSA